MFRTTRTAALVLVATLSLVGAACGSDNDDASDDTSEVAAGADTDDSATDDSATDDASTEDTTSDDSVISDDTVIDDTVEDGSDSTTPDVGGIDFDADFCGKLQDIEDIDENLLNTNDPEELADNVERVEGELEDLVDKAPDELKGDLQTLADAFGTLGPFLVEMSQFTPEDYQDPEVIARMEEIQAEMAATNVEEELDAATQRIEAYAEQQCGVDLSSS